ncbi:glycoside hydrolase family 75 protein [Streptomyces sp. NPDC052773]|uniref:glycoside hydrolase family 75 protein n=1 Tax=Streptomyces sp. NPDC052773 TaxID=3365693 RepID=UPI0037D59F36
MRVQSLALAAAGAALLAPTTLPESPAPVAATTPAPAAGPAHPRVTPDAAREGAVSAADLLAKARTCAPVSRGRYRSDEGAPADIPVCGTRDAVFWKADLDIDCDGRPGRHCNGDTDPYFSASTAFTQSDGRYLDAERLPFIVVPAASAIWNHRDDDVRGGSVAAVVHRDRVQYAVVGDVGPGHVIGEASYATAERLGINPDPRRGGTDSGVTYIVFKGSQASPIESHAAAVAEGERLARRWVDAG